MSRPRVLLAVMIVAGLSAAGALMPAHAQMEIPPTAFEAALEKAQAQERPLLVEVYAPWCPYCQRMQDTVYSANAVREYLDDHFVYVRVNTDTTAGTHQYDGRTLSTQELGSMLGGPNVPSTVFLEPDGTPIARQPGFIERPLFLKIIRYVGSDAYKNRSFQEFADTRSD